jgi:hypothetical protein
VSTTVATGPGMPPDAEAEHKRRMARTYAAEAEQAVAVIEEKIAGMQESLAAKRAEAEQLRAEADGGDR